MGVIYEIQRDQFGQRSSIASCWHSLMTGNLGVEIGGPFTISNQFG